MDNSRPGRSFPPQAPCRATTVFRCLRQQFRRFFRKIPVRRCGSLLRRSPRPAMRGGLLPHALAASGPDGTVGGRHSRGGILRCKSKCNVRHIYLLLRVDFIHRKTVSTLHLSRKKATVPHILRHGFVHKMIVIRRSQGAAVATAAVISRRQLRAPLRPVAPRYRLAVRRLSRQPGDNVRRGASAPRGYPPPPAWITPDNNRVSPVQRPAAPQRCPPGGGT